MKKQSKTKLVIIIITITIITYLISNRFFHVQKINCSYIPNHAIDFYQEDYICKKDNTNILIFSQKNHSTSPYLAIEVPNLKKGIKYNLSEEDVKFIGGALRVSDILLAHEIDGFIKLISQNKKEKVFAYNIKVKYVGLNLTERSINSWYDFTFEGKRTFKAQFKIKIFSTLYWKTTYCSWKSDPRYCQKILPPVSNDINKWVKELSEPANLKHLESLGLESAREQRRLMKKKDSSPKSVGVGEQRVLDE